VVSQAGKQVAVRGLGRQSVERIPFVIGRLFGTVTAEPGAPAHPSLVVSLVETAAGSSTVLCSTSSVSYGRYGLGCLPNEPVSGQQLTVELLESGVVVDEQAIKAGPSAQVNLIAQRPGD
jgi:hypothetical protein